MSNFTQFFQNNSQYWSNLFSSPWEIFINLVDIFLVTWLIYIFIKSLAGTKIMTLIQGVFLFIAASLLANFLGLQTIYWLMNQVITYGVIAIVIIFAPEIRTSLEKLGRASQFFTSSISPQSDEEKLIQAFLKTTDYLSPRKIGALVSVQGNQTLQEYISTGISLDADVSSELLINIFIPNTPLHDGAVIIRDGKIAVACAYLPLTEKTTIPKEFGTRHRAAIGLSENSDALTFIVSEETGNISLTYNGIFKYNLSRDDFENELRRILLTDETPKKGKIRFWKGGRG